MDTISKKQKNAIKNLTQVQYNMIQNLIYNNPKWRIDDYIQFVVEFGIIEDKVEAETVVQAIDQTLPNKNDDLLYS